MQHIAPESLNDLDARVAYLRDFIGFTQEDAAVLHAAKTVVAPLVPDVVDAVYTKLLSFDITAKSFVPRQTGYTGEAPTKLEDLGHDHPQIKFRKGFLFQYLVKLVSMDYDDMKSWEYLDKVGIMHTGVAGFAHRKKKPALRVEYTHCAILLGFVEDILVNAVNSQADLSQETKTQVLRAFNKLLWIQNDLFARHYILDPEVSANQITFNKSTLAAAAAGLVAAGAVIARFVVPHLKV